MRHIAQTNLLRNCILLSYSWDVTSLTPLQNKLLSVFMMKYSLDEYIMAHSTVRNHSHLCVLTDWP